MTLLAAATWVAIAYATALFLVLFVIPLGVTALKGQWLLFAAGWFTVGLVWWIAALRLGRPGSWWARRFYGADKLRRAEERYGEDAGWTGAAPRPSPHCTDSRVPRSYQPLAQAERLPRNGAPSSGRL